MLQWAGQADTLEAEECLSAICNCLPLPLTPAAGCPRVWWLPVCMCCYVIMHVPPVPDDLLIGLLVLGCTAAGQQAHISTAQ
jgi:hypothetical protein